MNPAFQNILFIKMSSMGDVVHAMPAAMALRERFAGAKITWLVDARFAELLAGHPAVDEVIAARAPAIPKMPLDHVLRAAFQYAVAGELRARGFDLAIDAQGLFRTGVLTAATVAGVRLGFANAREGAQMFYTRKVNAPREMHAVERCLKLAEVLGADVTKVRYGLKPSAENERAARKLRQELGMGADEPYAVIAPKSARKEKDWPVERFRELVGKISRELGLRTLVIGARLDEPTCREAAGDGGVVFCGQGLGVTLATIAGARVLVANDSGPLHLAAAMGTPLVGIFGPTDPARTGPYRSTDAVVRKSDGCPGCQRKSRKIGHFCLNALTVAEVWEKVSR